MKAKILKQGEHYILQEGENLRIHITKTSQEQVIFSIYDKDGELVSNVVPVEDFITGLTKMLIQ